MNPFGTGAVASHYDSRTWRHDTTLGIPLTKGGVHYEPNYIEHQHNVGICTAIHMTQNAYKATGKRFSPDFHYLLQKKYVDGTWVEGSSIFSALKVANKYGFLPIELFPYVTEADRNLPYSIYIAKLQAIPETEIARLLTLCTNKLAGYASIKTDPQSLAKGILDSKAGILCRYEVGEEWWTDRNGNPSWRTVDIDPLRPPAHPVSGHAITGSYFDYSVVFNIEFPNTWGVTWNDLNQGKGNINQAVYAPTEAWIPYYESTPAPLPPQFIFTQDIHYGETSEDVRQLQKRLGVIDTGFFGDLTRAAVIKYQDDNKIALTFLQRYWKRSCLVGPKTRAILNK